MIDILMPGLSRTMEERKLAKWLMKKDEIVKPRDMARRSVISSGRDAI